MSKAASLRRQLKKEGRSGAWLARATGYSEAYVSLVLSGRREMTEDFQRRAIDAMGRDPGFLDVFCGQVLRVPEKIFTRDPELPASVIAGELELAWRRSWVRDHGERVLAEASRDAWHAALALAGLDPETLRPVGVSE